MGWSIHEGVCNVITVPKRDMTVMVPYYGEDTMDAEVLDKLPKSSELFQSHIVRYVDPKGIVEQHVVIGGCLEPVVQETLGKGGELTDSQLDMEYEVFIYAHGDGGPDQLVWEGKRKVGQTIISKKSRNKKLQAIAKRSVFPRDYIVLNPSVDEKIEKEVSRSGFLKIVLKGSSRSEFVDASYDIQYTKTREMFRNVRRLFQKGQAAHLKQFTTANQHLLFMRATNNTGTATVLLTFAMNKVEGGNVPMYVDLLDLEIAVSRGAFKAPSNPGTTPTKPLSQKEKELVKTMEELDETPPSPPPYDLESSQIKTQYPFRCDPSSLEHVTALVMAMEDWMGHGELQSASVQAHFDTINTYRHTMEEALLRGDDPQAPSPKINAAINSATQEVWELVERGAVAKKLQSWKKSISKKGKATVDNVKTLNKVKKDLKDKNFAGAITELRKSLIEFDEVRDQGGEADQKADLVENIHIELMRTSNRDIRQEYTASLNKTGDETTEGSLKEYNALMTRARNIRSEITKQPKK
jgi:hypothetical protein